MTASFVGSAVVVTEAPEASVDTFSTSGNVVVTAAFVADIVGAAVVLASDDIVDTVSAS